MHGQRLAILAAVGIVVGFCAGPPASAADTGQEALATQAMAFEASAQSRRNRRARTRIQVYPRRYHLSPTAKRDCISWLEPEWRLSGTVIVPRLRCWWVHG
jgi:hypothetical protein